MISLLSPFKAAAIITMIRALIKLDGRTQEPVLPSLVLQGLNTYQASSPIYWPWWQQCQYIPVILKIVSRLRSLALTQAWILPQCSKKHFLGGWLNSIWYDVAQFFIRSQAMLKVEKTSRIFSTRTDDPHPFLVKYVEKVNWQAQGCFVFRETGKILFGYKL